MRLTTLPTQVPLCAVLVTGSKFNALFLVREGSQAGREGGSEKETERHEQWPKPHGLGEEAWGRFRQPLGLQFKLVDRLVSQVMNAINRQSVNLRDDAMTSELLSRHLVDFVPGAVSAGGFCGGFPSVVCQSVECPSIGVSAPVCIILSLRLHSIPCSSFFVCLCRASSSQ